MNTSCVEKEERKKNQIIGATSTHRMKKKSHGKETAYGRTREKHSKGNVHGESHICLKRLVRPLGQVYVMSPKRAQNIHSGVSFNSKVVFVSCLDQVYLEVMKAGSPSEAPVRVHVIAPLPGPPGPGPELARELGLGPGPELAV
jgi:hypothetical protein